jgi:hypothetical protein
MGFSGRIEDLPVVDLIQYLNAGRKDGTCVLSIENEKAFIYFHQGNVVHAVLPNRSNIGDILVQQGAIDLKTLQNALVLQADQKRNMAVGQILVEEGKISHEQLKEAMLIQLKEVIKHLVTWTKGDFSFEPNKINPVDDINLNPVGVLLKTEINTQHLLMAAVTQMDGEAEKTDPSSKAIQFPLRPTEPEQLSESPQAESRNENGRPVKAPSVPPPKDMASRIPEAGAKKNGMPAELKHTVILLSGEGIFKNLLRETMQNHGCTVVVPSSIEDCLAKGKQYISDGVKPVFIIDEHLGSTRSGRSATRILDEKAKSAWECIVVVMVEGPTVDATLAYYQSGAQVVIPKPIRKNGDNADFTTAVKGFCNAVQKLLQMTGKERQKQPV